MPRDRLGWHNSPERQDFDWLKRLISAGTGSGNLLLQNSGRDYTEKNSLRPSPEPTPVFNDPLSREPRPDQHERHAVAGPRGGPREVQALYLGILHRRPEQRKLVQPVLHAEGRAVLQPIPGAARRGLSGFGQYKWYEVLGFQGLFILLVQPYKNCIVKNS